MEQQRELERLEGTVEYVTYRNDDTGFTVFGLAIDNDRDLVTVVGELAEPVCEGEHLTLTGEYTAHPTYGQQFRAAICEKALPSTANAILKYLSARSIKGIGPTIAARLVTHFGDRTLDVMENNPERLTEVRGISPKKAAEIAEDFRRVYGVRMVMLFLARFNVHPTICVRVWKKWGAASVETLTENPYLLCGWDIGLGFEQADAIAVELGVAPDDPHRVAAALAFVLRHNLGNGHTCLPEESLVKIAAQLLETGREPVEQCLYEQAQEEALVRMEIDGRMFWYLPELFCAERYIAGRLMIVRSAFANPEPPDYAPQIAALEESFSIRYEALQKRAIVGALTNGVFLLTGGPGTGKTTIINAIIELFEQMGEKVLLAAPTGRAAKRMTEMTGREAKTIHRLLEVDFRAGDAVTFKRNERNPLDADVLIVDEMSMVDTLLFESLLRAMRLSCRLVLVGDADQLPSVGAGNVLRDLIDSDVLCSVQLKEIFRQAAQSLIVTNAHQIVRGEHPDLRVRDNDFFFLRSPSPEAVAATLKDLVARRLPAAYGFSALWDIQVLSPTRKGELGTMELNRRLQRRLNPPAAHKQEFVFGGYTFRTGDKVMQIRNNYDIVWDREGGEGGAGIFNGDIGEILQIDRGARMMLLRFDDKQAEYSFDMANELELAYAVTVHKSQGSEFEAVILPLGRPSRNLYYRNLLYTAVTRAKKLLILLGEESSVYYMVDNNKKTLRYTNLARLLREEQDPMGGAAGPG